MSAGKEVAGCTTDLPEVSETREGLGASLEVELLPELCSFWRRKWQPMPAFLPGESHGQRSLAGHSPGDCKESDRTEQLSLTHSLRTHSFYLWPQKCRVSGEVGKSSCIALPGRGDRHGLMPSGLCVPHGGDSEESKVLREQGVVSSSSDWLVVRSSGVSIISLPLPTSLASTCLWAIYS